MPWHPEPTAGVEPATSRLQVERSGQLSYTGGDNDHTTVILRSDWNRQRESNPHLLPGKQSYWTLYDGGVGGDGTGDGNRTRITSLEGWDSNH